MDSVAYLFCVATVVDKLRDHRLRHYYDVRYDYRNNLIDWDYTVHTHDGVDAVSRLVDT